MLDCFLSFGKDKFLLCLESSLLLAVAHISKKKDRMKEVERTM